MEEIYHLACPASPVRYQHHPVRTLKTAVLGTMNMLELTRDTGARILISSTSKIYGEPLRTRSARALGHVNPIGKRACHDEGKGCGKRARSRAKRALFE